MGGGNKHYFPRGNVFTLPVHTVLALQDSETVSSRACGSWVWKAFSAEKHCERSEDKALPAVWDDPGEQFSSKKEEVGVHLLIQSPNISGTPSFAHLFMSSFLFKWCLSISNKYTLGRIKKIPTVKD